MKEGTLSVLVGCHNPLFHGIWVLMAWRLEYKSWPTLWELVGIFLHDIGIWGRDYLSDDKAKIGHWENGALWTDRIVTKLSSSHSLGFEAGMLCNGHCPGESGLPESKLARADKRSHLIAPLWWEWSIYWIEWHRRGIKATPPPVWKKLVAENLKKELPLDSHELYIKNRR